MRRRAFCDRRAFAAVMYRDEICCVSFIARREEYYAMPMEEGTAWMVRGRGGDSRRRGGKVDFEGERLT